MKHFHKTTGTITYDPRRPGMTHRTQWWCVVNVSPEIARYYRWWLEFEKHIHLQPPAWGAHISLVRGEKPRDLYLPNWKKYDGQKIEIEYCHGIIDVWNSQRSDDRAHFVSDDKYYVIEVRSPQLKEIRKELGLPSHYDFHMTIGKTYEYQPRAWGRECRKQMKEQKKHPNNQK